MRKLLIFILPSFFLLSCKKKCENCFPGTNNPCGSFIYSKYSLANFDYIENNLIGPSLFGSTFFGVPPLFLSPCFNPKNDYEFLYIKSTPPNSHELWRFDLCKNEKHKITDVANYNMCQWSNKNWILFKGVDGKVYKIKPNGDSITTLTPTAAYDQRWSPNGKLFIHNNAGFSWYIRDEYGNLVKTIGSFGTFVDWYDNENLLVSNGQNLNLFNYVNETYSAPIHTSFSPGFFMLLSNNKKNCLVINNANQNNNPKYLLNYNLTNNKTDTIKKIYASYFYSSGSFNSNNNKVLLELYRGEWKDSISDEIYFRKNIVIMNLDGTQERMLNLD